MTPENFIRVIQATEASQCQALQIRSAPGSEDLEKLPPIRYDRDIHYTLALTIGSGSNVQSFSPAPSFQVDVTVCRRWGFWNGVFFNLDPILWPTVAYSLDRYGAVLLYDPNWPWNRLVVEPSVERRKLYNLLPPAVVEAVDSLGENSHLSAGQLTLYRSIAALNPGAKKIERPRFGAPGTILVSLESLANQMTDVRGERMRRHDDFRRASGLKQLGVPSVEG